MILLCNLLQCPLKLTHITEEVFDVGSILRWWVVVVSKGPSWRDARSFG